ncbi:MAG: response regulator [Gemmatimonadetes bacterium]|nr:response regulator [Gemmatimonadota bacterium]
MSDGTSTLGAGGTEDTGDRATPPQTATHALVLDDEPALVEVAIRILRISGRSGTGFTEADAAVAAFEQAPERFDVVVTDMRLRDVTGIDVSEQLSRLRPGVPILLIAGAPLGADVWDLAANAGVCMVLQKPYRLHELLDAIAHMEMAGNLHSPVERSDRLTTPLH